MSYIRKGEELRIICFVFLSWATAILEVLFTDIGKTVVAADLAEEHQEFYFWHVNWDVYYIFKLRYGIDGWIWIWSLKGLLVQDKLLASLTFRIWT